MTAWKNLCSNPAMAVSDAGWTTNGGWTRVTNITGMERATGWRLLAPAAAGYVRTPNTPATPGLAYTVSLSVKNFSQFNTTRPLWIGFARTPGGEDYSIVQNVPLATDTVTRVSISGVAPPDTTAVFLVLDTLNPGLVDGVSGWEVTAAMHEQADAASAVDYFDGASAGASWDGAAGLSTSTLIQVVEFSGAASLSAASAFGVSAVVVKPASVTAMTAATAFSAAGQQSRAGATAMTAASTLTTTAPFPIRMAAVALSAAGRLTAAPFLNRPSAVAMSAASKLNLGAPALLAAATAMSAASGLLAAAQQLLKSSIDMLAQSDLSARPFPGNFVPMRWHPHRIRVTTNNPLLRADQ